MNSKYYKYITIFVVLLIAISTPTLVGCSALGPETAKPPVEQTISYDTLPGVTADLLTQAFDVAMKQVHIQIISFIIWGTVWLLIGLLIVYLGIRYRRENSDHFELFLFIVGSIFILISIGLYVGCLKMGLNPEYYAIQLLLHGVSQ